MISPVPGLLKIHCLNYFVILKAEYSTVALLLSPAASCSLRRFEYVRWRGAQSHCPLCISVFHNDWQNYWAIGSFGSIIVKKWEYNSIENIENCHNLVNAIGISSSVNVVKKCAHNKRIVKLKVLLAMSQPISNDQSQVTIKKKNYEQRMTKLPKEIALIYQQLRWGKGW